MKYEERLQVGLAAFEKSPQVEREPGGQHQEDQDEYVGKRRREIGGQLAPEDDHDAPRVNGGRQRYVSVRNTSSMQPGPPRRAPTSTPPFALRPPIGPRYAAPPSPSADTIPPS